MKLYAESDFVQSQKTVRAATVRMLLCALPFVIGAVVGLVVRSQALCTACCILAGALVIFLYDLKVMPARRYRAHLSEIHSGLRRETVGALIRIDADPVHDIGLIFKEVTLNIYEDMDEEGERRFLLDISKTIPQEWIGSDVMVIHHGRYILEILPAEEMREA